MAVGTVLRIDGSYGEGGGQILRTALTLSAVLGQPVELVKIRAGRRNPGLQPQHLSCVKALAEITGAEVHGAEIGSSRLYFAPGRITGGSWRFDVGTAGALSLVLQAILGPLAFADRPSNLLLTGGTHVPWSPPAPYVSHVFLPMVKRMGLEADWQLERGGFYPKGGGRVYVAVQPVTQLSSINVTNRGALVAIRGMSAVAKLPRRIAERQADRIRCRVSDAGYTIDVDIAELDAPCPGDTVVLWTEFERTRAGFGALGERGKPAERVADEAVDALLDFLAGDAATEGYLADQLAVFMAMANGRSVLTTARVSRHLLTNLWTIRQFLPIEASVDGRLGGPGLITVDGVGLTAFTAGSVMAAIGSPGPASRADR